MLLLFPKKRTNFFILRKKKEQTYKQKKLPKKTPTKFLKASSMKSLV